MADFVTINGLKYYTAERAFKPTRNKSLQVNVTIDGKTVSQLFGFTDQKWDVKLLAYLSSPASGFGSLTNLRSAYDLAYCNFIDQDGVDQGDCFIEGDFQEQRAYSIIDSDSPFYIDLTLRKRQT